MLPRNSVGAGVVFLLEAFPLVVFSLGLLMVLSETLSAAKRTKNVKIRKISL